MSFLKSVVEQKMKRSVSQITVKLSRMGKGEMTDTGSK